MYRISDEVVEMFFSLADNDPASLDLGACRSTNDPRIRIFPTDPAIWVSHMSHTFSVKYPNRRYLRHSVLVMTDDQATKIYIHTLS